MFLYNKVADIAFLSLKDNTDEPDVLSGLDVFLWVSSFEYLLNGLFFGFVGFEFKDEGVVLVGESHIHPTLIGGILNTDLYAHRGKEGIHHRGVESLILVDVVSSVPVAGYGGEEAFDGGFK